MQEWKGFQILILVCILLRLLSSCTDLSELESRIDKLENNNSEIEVPRLISFSFRAQLNPEQLIEDVNGIVVGDSIVECLIPYLVNNKLLVADIVSTGDVYIDGINVKEQKRIDYSKPTFLTVYANDTIKQYKVNVHTYTGLPVLWIETENHASITSRDSFISAHLRLVEDIVNNDRERIIDEDIQIKGRGNRTWWTDPKKSFRLKFKSKVSVLGEPSDKSWCLLPNYNDKTMLRNQTAMYLGMMSCLEYTPHMHFVELMLNNQYHGTYQFSDKLKIDKHRVNVGSDGFLIEVDAHAPDEESSRMISLPHLTYPLNIKDPDLEYNSSDYDFVKKYMLMADSVLYSVDFKDTDKGWQKYFDKESLVDWYLIHEISKNLDTMWSSSYMNFKKGGKIHMGPLWDFDQAFGTEMAESPYGYYVKEKDWFQRFWEDPYFVQLVKTRFIYFYDKKEELLNKINNDASYLKYSVIENNNRWDVLYKYIWRNYTVWGCYQNEVTSMKQWIVERLEWMKADLESR